MKNLLLILCLILLPISILAQAFENGFDFNLPWNDTARVEFLPFFDQDSITDLD